MKKINSTFAILKTLGIIFVVSGHLIGNGGISYFTEWFPVYSFHLPLFAFIAGYFYKKNNEIKFFYFFLKKFKKIIIPYFIWNFIYGIIVTILLSNNIIDFGVKLNFETLFISPFTNGQQFAFNLASWFAIPYFLSIILYTLIRKLFSHIKKINEYFYMLIFLTLGLLSVYFSNMGYNQGFYLTIMRCVFLLPFFEFGFLYNQVLEKKDKLRNLYYFLIIFFIQFILIYRYENITFSLVSCNDFNNTNILLPFITSLTGIMFWVRISKILSAYFEGNKLIEYISKNTFSIMTHHLFIFFVINTFLRLLFKLINIGGFNVQMYRTNIFYVFLPFNYNFSIVYLLLGIAVPLISKYFAEKIIDKFKLKSGKLLYKQKGKF